MKTLIAASFLLTHRSFLILIFLVLQLPVVAQETQPEIRQLVGGERTTRRVIADEEDHLYAIEMKRGQVLRVSFQEKGADVNAVMLRISNQQKASAASNFGSGFMAESLTLIDVTDGVYLLFVRAQRVTHTNVDATYELSTELRNTVTQNDIQRAKAEVLMDDAGKLLEGSDSASSSLAVTKYEQSINIWELLGEDYWAAIARGSMASAVFKLGDFTKAELLFKRVLETFTHHKNEPAIAMVSMGLVGVYMAGKNEPAARQYLQKVFEISQRLGDKRTQSLLGSLSISTLTNEANGGDFDRNLAAARAKHDKLAEASVWAKELFRYVIEEDSIEDEEQRTFFEKAEREALPLLNSVSNRDIKAQIFLGLGIGAYDLTLGRNTDEAEDLANKEKSLNYIAYAIVLARVQNNSLIQWLAYTYLDLFYDGDIDRLAILFGKKSINSLQYLKQDFRLFDKESQQYVAREMDEVYSSVASDLFFEGRLAEAHQILNLSRDQEYFDFNLNRNQEPARSSLTPHELENEQLFDRTVENLAAQYSRTDTGYQLAGKELRVILRRMERSFNAPPSNRDIASNVTDTVDMQSALRELSTKAGKKYAAIYIVEDVGEILLITPNEVFAFASSTDIEDLKNYVSSFEIDEDILNFLLTLRSANLDPRPLGARIYNKLFKTKELVNDRFTGITLEEKLKRLKPDVLLWSLSGNLRYVPVAALYDASTNQYLVEKYQNAVFTRARKERFLIEPKEWNRSVGFGTSVGYGDLSPLPDVPDELAAIFGNPATGTKGFFTGKVLLNRAFTRPAMVTTMQSQPALVHIASHFIFRPGDSRNSFLLLGDGSRFSLLDMYRTPNLFAGVDLLTLSACETAGQQPGADGKEVDAFAELAQRLGASSVMATLWIIPDDGTSKFMTEFYRLRQANPKAPKSEILQQAQLKFLTGKDTAVSAVRPRRTRSDIVGLNEKLTGIPFTPSAHSPLEHPYYWASFVLFGSSR